LIRLYGGSPDPPEIAREMSEAAERPSGRSGLLGRFDPEHHRVCLVGEQV
jgi:hypothetical protein